MKTIVVSVLALILLLSQGFGHAKTIGGITLGNLSLLGDSQSHQKTSQEKPLISLKAPSPASTSETRESSVEKLKLFKSLVNINSNTQSVKPQKPTDEQRKQKIADAEAKTDEIVKMLNPQQKELFDKMLAGHIIMLKNEVEGNTEEEKKMNLNEAIVNEKLLLLQAVAASEEGIHMG